MAQASQELMQNSCAREFLRPKSLKRTFSGVEGMRGGRWKGPAETQNDDGMFEVQISSLLFDFETVHAWLVGIR